MRINHKATLPVYRRPAGSRQSQPLRRLSSNYFSLDQQGDLRMAQITKSWFVPQHPGSLFRSNNVEGFFAAMVNPDGSSPAPLSLQSRLGDVNSKPDGELVKKKVFELTGDNTTQITPDRGNRKALLAARIVELRKRLKFTQGRLAKEIGVSPSYMCQIEKAGAMPSLTMLRKLEACLMVGEGELSQLYPAYDAVKKNKTRYEEVDVILSDLVMILDAVGTRVFGKYIEYDGEGGVPYPNRFLSQGDSWFNLSHEGARGQLSLQQLIDKLFPGFLEERFEEFLTQTELIEKVGGNSGIDQAGRGVFDFLKPISYSHRDAKLAVKWDFEASQSYWKFQGSPEDCFYIKGSVCVGIAQKEFNEDFNLKVMIELANKDEVKVKIELCDTQIPGAQAVRIPLVLGYSANVFLRTARFKKQTNPVVLALISHDIDYDSSTLNDENPFWSEAIKDRINNLLIGVLRETLIAAMDSVSQDASY
jgi:transcriptional regulator with XRE-family HTH domain